MYSLAIATASSSSALVSVVFSSQSIDRSGKQKWFFTRENRSSCTAAMTTPSSSTQAEALCWSLIPRIFTGCPFPRTCGVAPALEHTAAFDQRGAERGR
jgi:hypothetical protein